MKSRFPFGSARIFPGYASPLAARTDCSRSNFSGPAASVPAARLSASTWAIALSNPSRFPSPATAPTIFRSGPTRTRVGQERTAYSPQSAISSSMITGCPISYRPTAARTVWRCPSFVNLALWTPMTRNGSSLYFSSR